MAAEPTLPTDNGYLLLRLASDLAPNLADKPADRAPALRMAWQMVRAYHPGNEAEATTAARIVSLSMTQLDLLRESTRPDLTPAMKLRIINAAVRVNREVNQTERALERRQLAEERRPVAQQPVEAERINRSSNKAAVDEAIIAKALQEMTLMDAHRRQQAAAEPAQPEPVQPEAARPEAAQPEAIQPDAPLFGPVADPVEPAARPAGWVPPPATAEAVRAFFRHTEQAHANHHAALAAGTTAKARALGAGAPRPGAQSASSA